MRRFQLALLAGITPILLAVPARAQTPALLWAKTFTGGGLQSATALHLRGTNLWVSGLNNGTIDFGGPTIAAPLNAYLALFSADGAYQWGHGFNVGGGVITGVGADATNNVYITGQFSGTVDFGGGPLASLGGYDIFLAKFNSAGVHQWSKRFGDASGNDAGLALVVDNLNYVIIAGRFSGTTNFGGGALTTAGSTDAFLVKFNASGVQQWAQKFGDAAGQEIDALTTNNGDIYATGSYYGTINLGGTAFTSAGQNDIFLARFTSAGVHQWSKSFGSASFDKGEDVDTDGFGVYLLANIEGSVNFGGSALPFAGSQDVAVAKFTTAGVHTWSKSFGDGDTQTGSAIDVAGSGVYVTGFFEGGINFGHTLFTSSASNVFLARLAPFDGAGVWSQQFGYPQNGDIASDVVSDGSHTFIGGYYTNDIDFGYNGALFSPARDYDAFLAEFGFNAQEPAIVSVKDVGNDQGGKVRIRFTRSEYDAATSVLPIRGYEIFLRDDPLNRTVQNAGAAAETWILAGDAPAHGISDVYTLAFTLQDSTVATGMHTSNYKVRAVTDSPSVYFDSPVVGGYSLDNLAPGVPLNLVLHDGELSWHPGSDPDVIYYTVYGSSGGFDESAVHIGSTATLHMDVRTREFAHYYVTATDRAGNESRAAALDGAGPSPLPRTLSVSAFPNPFNPLTTIRYTLPAAGHVRIDVFDASGTRVRSLVDREQPAGAFMISWDGRNDAGHAAASGIYFARLEHNGATRSYKLVMLK